MKMTSKNILQKLIVLHEKFSRRRESNPESQMCMLWPIDDLPDTLLCTDASGVLENEFQIELTEDTAIELYDVSLREASLLIEKMIAEQRV